MSEAMRGVWSGVAAGATVVLLPPLVLAAMVLFGVPALTCAGGTGVLVQALSVDTDTDTDNAPATGRME